MSDIKVEVIRVIKTTQDCCGPKVNSYFTMKGKRLASTGQAITFTNEEIASLQGGMSYYEECCGETSVITSALRKLRNEAESRPLTI